MSSSDALTRPPGAVDRASCSHPQLPGVAPVARATWVLKARASQAAAAGELWPSGDRLLGARPVRKRAGRKFAGSGQVHVDLRKTLTKVLDPGCAMAAQQDRRASFWRERRSVNCDGGPAGLGCWRGFRSSASQGERLSVFRSRTASGGPRPLAREAGAGGAAPAAGMFLPRLRWGVTSVPGGRSDHPTRMESIRLSFLSFFGYKGSKSCR